MDSENQKNGIIPGQKIAMFTRRARSYRELASFTLSDVYASFAAFDYTRQSLRQIHTSLLLLEAMLTPYITGFLEKKRGEILKEIESMQFNSRADIYKAFLLYRKWLALMVDQMYKKNLLMYEGEEAKV